MARYIALAAAQADRFDRFEILRGMIVCGCALALILAERALPL